MPKDHGFAFHPIALIFPLLEGDELEALAENIRANGLWESAWLYEGKVLDGRNRATACKLAGVTLKTREFKGDRLAALRFVWSENFHRRHLNPSQAAVAEAKRGKLGAEYGAEVEKMKEAQPKGGRPKKGEKPRQQIAEVSPDERKTSDRRAKSVGSNRRYLEAAEKLLEESPEKLVPVEKGEKTLSRVLREEKREQVQAKLAAFPSRGLFAASKADGSPKYRRVQSRTSQGFLLPEDDGAKYAALVLRPDAAGKVEQRITDLEGLARSLHVVMLENPKQLTLF